MKEIKFHTPARHCPVCNAARAVKIGHFHYALFEDLAISGDKELVQCASCGLLYDDTPLTENDLSRYYAGNSHYEFVYSGKLGNEKFESQDRLDRIIDILVKHTFPTHKILDVGCSRGELLLRCRERGFQNVAGVEIGDATRKAAQDAGLTVVSDLSELSGDKPDIIVISHVLEHLLEPLKMLETLAKFAPDSLVYIEVPATEDHFLNAVEWGRLYFEHINHYTRDSLRTLGKAINIEFVDDGSAFYSEKLKVPCRWFIGRFPSSLDSVHFHPVSPEYFYPALPSPGGDAVSAIPADGRPFALWGVSQYAMLLLGSRPELANVKRLFDASPAKIGRSVKGIKVEHSSKLSSLTDDYILLIPKSNFLPQMRSLIPTIGFKGTVLEI